MCISWINKRLYKHEHFDTNEFWHAFDYIRAYSQDIFLRAIFEFLSRRKHIMRKVTKISRRIQEVACNWSQFTATAPPNLTAGKSTLPNQLFSAHVNNVDTYRYCRYLSTVPVRQADDVIGIRKRINAFWHVRPCSVAEVGRHFGDTNTAIINARNATVNRNRSHGISIS